MSKRKPLATQKTAAAMKQMKPKEESFEETSSGEDDYVRDTKNPAYNLNSDKFTRSNFG